MRQTALGNTAARASAPRQLALLLWLRLVLVWRGMLASKTSLGVTLFVLAVLAPLSLFLGYGAWEFGRAFGPVRVNTAYLLFTFVYLFWFNSAIRGFLSNDFFDITKILHLPLPPSLTYVATLIGGLLGIGPLFMLPAFVGLTLGLSTSPILFLVRILLFVIFVLHLIAVPRLFSYFFQWLSGFRFIREWGIVIVTLAWAAFMVFLLSVLYSGEALRRVNTYAETLAPALRFLPPVWFADTFLFLTETNAATHLPFLIAFLPLTGFSLVAAGLLQYRLAGMELVRSGRRRARRGRGVGFIGNLLMDLVPLAFAWHQLKLLWRDPFIRTRALMTVLPVAFTIVIFQFLAAPGGPLGDIHAWLPYLLTFILLNAQTMILSNLLGPEGPGLQALMSFPVSRAWILLGKNVALWGFFLIMNVPIVIFLGAFYQMPQAVPICLAGMVVLLTLYCGLGNVMSVLAPLPMVGKGGNALKQANRRNAGCQQSLVYYASAWGTRLVSFPFVAAFAVPFFVDRQNDWQVWALVIAATLPLVLIVYTICLLISAKIMNRREEWLIQTFVTEVE